MTAALKVPVRNSAEELNKAFPENRRKYLLLNNLTPLPIYFR
jgi:hypothetical protein